MSGYGDVDSPGRQRLGIVLLRLLRFDMHATRAGSFPLPVSLAACYTDNLHRYTETTVNVRALWAASAIWRVFECFFLLLPLSAAVQVAIGIDWHKMIDQTRKVGVAVSRRSGGLVVWAEWPITAGAIWTLVRSIERANRSHTHKRR